MWIGWALGGFALVMGWLTLMMHDWPVSALRWFVGGGVLSLIAWGCMWWYLFMRRRRGLPPGEPTSHPRTELILVFGAVLGSFLFPFVKGYIGASQVCGFWAFLGVFLIGASVLLPRLERAGLIR